MLRTTTKSRFAPNVVRSFLASVALLALCASNLAGARTASDAGGGGQPASLRPFGTLQEQAEAQQAWLKKRLETFLPALMRKHGIDLWIVPMREHKQTPIFAAGSGAHAVP